MSEPSIGHNVPKEQLKSIVERIERLGEDIKSLQDDRSDIYAEAKSGGWDVKTLRKVIQLRKLDANERMEQQTVLETYLHALGME